MAPVLSTPASRESNTSYALGAALMLGIVAVHAYFVFGPSRIEFLTTPEPFSTTSPIVAWAMPALYLLVVWAGTRALQPSAKAGSDSGKPFSGDEEKALALVRKSFKKTNKLIEPDAVRIFLEEQRKKFAAEGVPTPGMDALLDRPKQEPAARLVAVINSEYDVRGAKAVYNMYQVIFNIIMVAIIGSEAWRFSGYSVSNLWSFPEDRSMAGNLMTYGLYLHYVNKYLEFFDTVFMMLAGNWRQVTTLHVVHHAIMGPVWFVVLQTDPNGQPWLGSTYNSFIHVIMYSYYLVTSFGLDLSVLKMYITLMQLIQFVVVGAHAIFCMAARFGGDSKAMSYTTSALELGVALLMIQMFSGFFIKEYCARSSNTPSKAKLSSSSSSSSSAAASSSSAAMATGGGRGPTAEPTPLPRK